MSPTLRVVHVLRGAQGGSFRHLCDLAKAQADSGAHVGIVSSTGIGGAATDAAFEALRPHCVLGVHRIPIKRTPGWSDVLAVRAIEGVLREARPHIVHGHGAKGAAYARLAAPRVGAKAVYTPHGGSLHYSWSSASGAVYLGLERALKRRTHGMIFASDYARRAYERKLGAPPSPCRVIHNGLHDEEFEPVPTAEAEYDFVFVGEMRRLKGIEVLVDAVAELREERQVSVLMVGAGPDEARLRARIEELDLARSITLSPPIQPARDAFAKARCVVMPSLAESLPYIVLEVLAARVPLLATRVGGIPEIFGPHQETLLPPGDAGALAQAMASFLNDPAPAKKQAAVLHAHVSEHARVPQMVEATGHLYESVLGRRSPATPAMPRGSGADPAAARTGHL